MCTALFGLLTWQEAVRGRLLALDGPVRSAIAGPSVRPAGRSFFMQLLADLGDAPVAVPVLATAMVYTMWRLRRAGGSRWWLPALAYTLAMAAVPGLVSLLKPLIGRAGPGSLTLSPGYPGLYPSGHAATAAVAYGGAALLLAHLSLRAAARRLLGTAAVLLNVAVGVSLVRCGYHWPLDVVGSWLLCGALLAGAALAVSCWSGNRG
ncbi:phosphatase PAP2 family protein [Streptomyces sp. MI02-7b]|uniref:phosphatase PAP2 family protein n=1 Tax=Streptomyces sp. MI02-7b TaxID=462941 RepID=UPI0029B2F79C|nr:phosphatase PAP2 family protein [Streptomyces sp. MI02-7b]MDX3072951.1 phosphatase PAP2 family protein [Streptomyces sp. MI02-7b]